MEPLNTSDLYFYEDMYTNETFFPSGFPSKNTVVAWCVFLSLEALLITICNLLTIITFAINRHLQKRSSYCLINLAVADLMVGSVAIPMNVYNVGLVYGFWGVFMDQDLLINIVYTSLVLHVFSGLASLFALVLMSMERMLATVWPLRHRTFTNRLYIFGFSIQWFIAAAVSAVWTCSLIYLDLNASLYVWIPSMFISVIVICASYIAVFIAVKLQNKKHQNSLQKSTFRKEKELAVTLFIVAAISLASWVPYAVVEVINFRQEISLPFSVLYAAILLANLNSLINPIVYVFRMLSFRSALIRLILKCSRDKPARRSLTNSRHENPTSELNYLIAQRRQSRPASSIRNATLV
ncbi:adenosine receptor A3-like [Actinia tenebrosa]|uniref:Adenosine receptor A3-like n=1 Tax=Actinia tenebrosa TaxID=6105 RepID=A0A6P8IZN2_ACTTE|nr:adenosine receptor A3-like [Actinia tenebrosa]